MTARSLDAIAIAWTAAAVATFLVLLRVAAPYGRHARAGWGRPVPAALAWIVMEAPSPLVMAALFATGGRRDAVSCLLAASWLAHYVYRAFVFPFLGRGRPMPVSIVASAFAFNLVNAGLNGLASFHLGPSRDAAGLHDPVFVAGGVSFVAGFAIHARADAILRSLRGPGDSGYAIPRGFLFERVSCPNYLGEIVEWCGWALMARSAAGLSFAVWTVANLAPRALAHHRWYRERFADYPPQRRALVPYVW